MRLLIACPGCHRQYDASDRAIGSRFRCHCGRPVSVRQPEGHDAEVVRCSSCGGPRAEGQSHCGFCGADFTLHDRDLDTVCPGCLARVSERASYCHHCGNLLSPQQIARTASAWHCPACGPDQRLDSRALPIAGLNVLECPRCVGEWLDLATFAELVKRAESKSLDARSHLSPRRSRSASVDDPNHAAPGRSYRPCPLCNDFMVPRSYGRHSGIVIDLCRKHGAWFDADELARILDWVAAGNLRVSQAEEQDEKRRAENLRKRTAPPAGGLSLPTSEPSMWSVLANMLGDVLSHRPF